MKKRKTNLLTLLGIVALVLASVNFYAPNPAYAYAGTKQFVLTTCDGQYFCNDCVSGTNTCSDNTCSQCKPADQ